MTMTSDVYCPKCGRKLLVGWEFGAATATNGFGDAVCDFEGYMSHVLYDYKRKCPYCGTELEISHVLVPHFTAEFAR
jgi:DNA-directed RNA polymerase subunit RPC12/RpoP